MEAPRSPARATGTLPWQPGQVTAEVSGALGRGLSLVRAWAEPCAVLGCRCWVPPATPSAFSHTGPAQRSTGWLDADGQVWTGRLGVGLATSWSWSQRRLGCWVTSFLYEKQLLPFASWSLRQGLWKECGGWCPRATSRGGCKSVL